MNVLISNNARYFMNGNTIYDVLLDESYNKNELSFEFWVNFLRENTIASYKNNIKNITEIQKFLRESVYNFATILEDKESTKFIVEYERKYANNLLNEDIEDHTNSLNEVWDYIGITLFEQDLWSSIKSGVSKIGSSIKSGLSKAWDFIKEKGAPWFFENLRKALFSWGGVAIQAFLAHPSIQAASGGITSALILTIWGAMLAYDVYEAIQGRPNWIYLLIDIVSLLTAGVGGKMVQGAAATIPKSSAGSLSKVLTELNKSSAGKSIATILKGASSGLSKVLGLVSSGIKWVGEKLGIKTLLNSSSQINSFITKTMSGLSKAASTSLGSAAVAGGIGYGIEKAVGGEGKTLGGAFKDDGLSNTQSASLEKAFQQTKAEAIPGVDYPEF